MTLDEQITLYALGALDEREALALEDELRRDPSLRARLVEERAAAALLLASDPITPSPRVKRSLLARIDATLTQPAAKARPSAESPIELSTIVRWMFRGLSVAAAAAAIVLAFGLLQTQNALRQTQVQVAQLQSTVEQSEAALEQAGQRIATLEQEQAESRARLAQAQEDAMRSAAEASAAANTTQSTVDALQARAEQSQAELTRLRAEVGLLSQAGARAASLPANQPGYEQGAVTVFYSPQSNDALITVANLPPLPQDQIYQVWLIKGDQALPSDIFNTGTDGQGRWIVRGDEPFSAYTGVGITVEPAGGRPTPNPDGPIYLGRIASS